ncbi:ABC transporter ATP-binding protein [uncultured Thermanaerothrix sp.]|uniref:ABC transporter ATP-binding protein n=1 Tax=uncultured Thermanaerothrix sp. TaxID=1195149 RepID=UPI002639E563|nr:ABC transporter ATP-binding protein [uncultured Thermanaerothrix sp.]
MDAPLLRFENVAFRYPETSQDVLQGLTLEVPQGQVTAILGPNGAGKTTLLRLAYGRYLPRRGRVWLEGRLLAEYSRQEIGRIVALVPQREANPFAYSLLEYVLLGRAPYLLPLQMPAASDVTIAWEALERVGLHHLARRSVQALSGGEYQLLLVARALAQQPRLLLLDEPTSHLDLANKKHLIECLRSLLAEGVTILMTSHEPEVVAALAQQVVLMRDGQVLHSGPLETLWNAETLSATYNVPLRVWEFDGHRLVTWE